MITSFVVSGADVIQGDDSEILNDDRIDCFTAGTMILTARGERAIETLEVGDLVFTLDQGYQPIRWIGRKRKRAEGAFAPVRFAAGTIGNNAAFEVSQNHRIMLRSEKSELLFGESEVLVAAKFLIRGSDICVRQGGWVDYVHILFQDHQIVITDNVASESLYPSSAALKDGTSAGQEELFKLFPEAFNHDPPINLSARMCLCDYEARLLCA